jgi:hypothetical protein
MIAVRVQEAKTRELALLVGMPQRGSAAETVAHPVDPQPVRALLRRRSEPAEC